jgi:hypothetical protein
MLNDGQALLDALRAFSERSNHPELVNAPLLLWGILSRWRIQLRVHCLET